MCTYPLLESMWRVLIWPSPTKIPSTKAKPNQSNEIPQFDEKEETQHHVRVDVLDFAGQIEYYVTHQLFLSDIYCVYVLVSSLYKRIEDGSFKLQSGVCAERLRYWMSFIRCLFNERTKVPAVIALTHGDCGNSHQDAQHYADSSNAESFRPPLHGLNSFVVDYSMNDSADGVSMNEGSKNSSPRSVYDCLVSELTNIYHRILIPGSYNSADKAIQQEFDRLEKGKKLPILTNEELMKIVKSSHEDLKENDALSERAVKYLVGTGTLYKHNLNHHLDPNSNSNSHSSNNSDISQEKYLFILNPLRWLSSMY